MPPQKLPRPTWSSLEGKERPRSSFELPPNYEWVGDWHVDHSPSLYTSPPGSPEELAHAQLTDESGWQFGSSFSLKDPSPWYPAPQRTTFFQRRKWVRVMQRVSPESVPEAAPVQEAQGDEELKNEENPSIKLQTLPHSDSWEVLPASGDAPKCVPVRVRCANRDSESDFTFTCSGAESRASAELFDSFRTEVCKNAGVALAQLRQLTYLDDEGDQVVIADGQDLRYAIDFHLSVQDEPGFSHLNVTATLE